MNTEVAEFRCTIHDASPAAFDEVFAGLPIRTLDPKPFRALADDLDRQHERLQQLLRDLDAVPASE